MIKNLQNGDLAPTFHGVDQNGQTISLENTRGKKVLVAFFRNAACALCNLHVHQLINRFPEWNKQGLEIIALFESPVENVHAHVGTQQAPFPLLADPKAEIYDLYSVETSKEKMDALLKDEEKVKALTTKAEAAGFSLVHEEGSNFNRLPAEFLIDEHGIIYTAHYNEHVSDHLPFEIIDEFVYRK
ncbi:peroxiredoxin family protein [Shimazuella kribbensis]|uniref:peroxiredoxin family protein n=1 Tax=Shimazuella kribbensis TaxID=139808 RepID=UPI00042862D7|nr:redoxin domain-containing protein [Shimazuella kribbensis]